MTPEILEHLKAAADRQEQVALAVAATGHQQSVKAYSSGATTARLKDMKAAEQHLREVVDGLLKRYPLPGAQVSAPGNLLAATPWDLFQPTTKAAEAFRFLLSHGWEVAERTVRRAVEQNRLRRDRSGRITGAALRRYAATYCLREVPADQTIEAAETEDLGQQKARLEVDKLRLEVERRELENRREDRRWILRDDAWVQVAGLLGLLRDGLRHHAHQAAEGITRAARGDLNAAPEVYDAVEQATNAAFNELADMDHVSVVFDRLPSQDGDDGFEG